MKLNSEHFKKEIEKILNEDGLSPEELSNTAKISRGTVYRILNLESKTTQRAIGRKIAEGTGRVFKIEGDKIYFSIPKPEMPLKMLSVEDEQWEKLSPDTKRQLIEIARMFQKMPHQLNTKEKE